MRHPLSSAPSRRRPAPSRVVRVVAGAVVIAAVTVLPSPAVHADGNEAPGAPLAARAISAGFLHTCALLDDGSVRCWGGGEEGQLGQGHPDTIGDEPGEVAVLPAVALGTGRTATALATGSRHSCALLDDATVRCWGLGGFGQTGQGTGDAIGDEPGEMGDALPAIALGTGRTATAITANLFHSCALLDNGSVKCWGYGAFGQTGQGATTNIGDQPGEMGDALPPIALGTGRTATAIAAGAYNTCALLDNGSVKCWGDGLFGANGQGATTSIGNLPGQMGDALPPIALGAGRTATAITGGSIHICALLDNGSVKCWGDNGQGRLGQGDTDDIGDDPGEMGDALPAVALGTGRTATAVTAGSDHTCALLDDGSVKCWGSGLSGATGQGSPAHIGDDPGEMGDNLPAVALGTGRTATAVTAGNAHTCAVLDDGTVKCWGAGGSGRLGLGSTSDRGTAPGEMGDALPAVALPDTVGLGPPAPPVTRRPDALVRVGKKAFAGNDVYNTTGKRQTRAAKVKKGKKVTFTVRAQNDGNAPDALRVRGPRSTRTFTITYRAGTKNITKKVVKGTYRTPSLTPGASRDITVTITPTKKATKNKKAIATVTVTSIADTTKKDTVKAVATRK
jgi:alpha-tubulin suppressor-like RCC1 family protein